MLPEFARHESAAAMAAAEAAKRAFTSATCGESCVAVSSSTGGTTRSISLGSRLCDVSRRTGLHRRAPRTTIAGPAAVLVTLPDVRWLDVLEGVGGKDRPLRWLDVLEGVGGKDQPS